MPDLRVIVADDQLLVRAGIQHLLQEIEGFVCLATLPDGEQALSACEADPPDVLLLDMHMPGPDGLSVTHQVLARHPALHVVILSSDTSAELARRALAAGARGYVSKDFVLDELAAMALSAAAGRVYLSPDIALAAMQVHREPEVALTPITRAISLLDCPWAMPLSTSHCRGVSATSGSRCTCMAASAMSGLR